MIRYDMLDLENITTNFHFYRAERGVGELFSFLHTCMALFRDGQGSGWTVGGQGHFYGGGNFLSFFSLIQCLPDLTTRLGPSQLFVKPGNSLNPKFLWSNQFFSVRNQFVKPG